MPRKPDPGGVSGTNHRVFQAGKEFILRMRNLLQRRKDDQTVPQDWKHFKLSKTIKHGPQLETLFPGRSTQESRHYFKAHIVFAISFILL